MKSLRAILALLALFVIVSGKSLFAATPYVMSGGDYLENFNGLGAWANDFASGTGAAPFGSVAIAAVGTIPNGTNITVATSTFQTAISSSTGIQRGTNNASGNTNLIFLGSGSTDNTTAIAVDLYLDFTARTAGTLSFDYTNIANSTGNRVSTIKVYTSTNLPGSGLTNFTELTAAVVSATNNIAFSGSRTSIALPSIFNGAATARIRFYYYNGGTATTSPTGSRPKIAIDNIAVTSTSSCASPTAGTPTISPSASVCAGTAIVLTESASGGTAPYAYQWKIGGSTITGATNANYTNTSPVAADSGTYTCDVTSACGGSAATSAGLAVTVTANATPSVGITSSVGTTTCSSATVIFTASPTNGGVSPTYIWKTNGVVVTGVTGSTYTNIADLVNGETIDCQLTSSLTCVTTSTANAATLTMTISGSVTPTVSISTSPSTTICSGSTVIFTAVPTGGGSTPTYVWKTNAVVVSDVTGSSYTNLGTLANGATIDCQLTSSDSCASPSTADASAVTLTVNATPSTPTPANDGPVCAGGTLNLTTPTVSGATYSWTGPNGFASSAQNPSISGVTVTANGTYTNTVTVGTCTSAEGTTVVVVNAAPSAAITASPSLICPLSTGNTATIADVAGSTYGWTISGGTITSITTTNTVTYTASASGTANLSVSVTNLAGCVSSSSSNVTIVVLDSTITVDSSVCGGGAGDVASVANAGAGSTYAWTISGGTINSGTTTNTITFTPNASGTVTLGCTVTVGGCSSVGSANSTITTAPTKGAYSMAGGNFLANFSDLTHWGNAFVCGSGSDPWTNVAVIGTGSSTTSGTRTTKSSATFVSGVSGGLQRGASNLVFLSTGSSATPEAIAVDLLLDFTGRDAGTLSFDWAAIDNSAGTRPTSLRVFWSTDNSTFTELAAAQVLDVQNPGGTTSGTISAVALPSAFNGSATARLRFYNHAGTVTGSGNRDKISIDNVAVTSTCAGPAISASSYSVTENKGVTFKLNDASVLAHTTGNSLAIGVISPSANGVTVSHSGTNIYYAGALTANDSFTYSVTNLCGEIASGTISITATNGIGQTTGNVTLNVGNAELMFYGISTSNYTVQVSTDLSSWTDVGSVAASTNGVINYTNFGAPTPNAYYRLKY